MLVFAWAFLNCAAAQSLVTGSIEGVVKDPKMATVPNAPVDLRNMETGEKQSTVSNTEGVYRFVLLKPGVYEVSVAMEGLAGIAPSTVSVGQTTRLDLDLAVPIRVETIMRKSDASLISNDPGTVTVFPPTAVALLPAAGGDMTTIAFTAPGVLVAPANSIGNFSVNGLPATSNLFTINGENHMDPYVNINASGATNLTLGLNEVEEASVVTNPYSGEYGQLSGAQVSYVTKSGTNAFHGNVQWWWNGGSMNSNDFFSNATKTPRPFANANQWAASIGGPIIKDHTWFFVDTEGMRFILPNVGYVDMPTPGFASAVISNIQSLEPAEASAYQSMFNIYAQAAKGKIPSVLPVNGSECANITMPGWTTGSPCSQLIITAPTTYAKEWILAGRVDHRVNLKDGVFFRFQLDRGLQPTMVDQIDAAFNATSNQPSYDFQVQERHAFTANLANVFVATAQHYSAKFVQDISEAQKAFPFGAVNFNFSDGFSPINPEASLYPVGRNITQYQFIDDLSWLRREHSMKFGVNFRRYDVSDFNFFNINPTTTFDDLTAGPGTSGLQAFANGIGSSYQQQDSVLIDVPIALWGIGLYAEDDWRVSTNLTVIAALRFERNSNPVCQKNCFGDFRGPFPTLPSVQAGAGAGDVPYSSDIKTNLHQAYMGTDSINLSPRMAFSWSPWDNDKTLVSGGIGIFYDNLPAGTVDVLLSNPPSATLFNILPVDANFQTTGILPFDKIKGGPAAFAAASEAFSVSKTFNQLSNELNPIIGFNPPITYQSFQGTLHSPQVQEWNLKLTQQVGPNTVVSVDYVGNHSIHIPFYNSWWNAAPTNSVFAAVPGVGSTFVPNYGDVTTIQSGAVSNHNGVTFSVVEQYHSWFFGHINYTYAHTLDETSNGGIFRFGGISFQHQVNPLSLRANNYGNADYDIRHLFNADYVFTPRLQLKNRVLQGLLAGWQWSGKVYVHSGLPFTVLDGRSFAAIAQGGGAIVAQQITGGASTRCGEAAVYLNNNPVPCLNNSAFLDTSSPNFTGYTSFPNQTRNQFRGPHYIDIDMSVFKTHQFRERLTLGLGATAFNVFNHPNFGPPDNSLGNSTFGELLTTQGPPVSAYGGPFYGYDASVRVIQLSAKLTF